MFYHEHLASFTVKKESSIFIFNFSHFRDARGMTPFMSAVSGRAYPAAITILETAQKIAKGN
jgi:hypothetical protein